MSIKMRSIVSGGALVLLAGCTIERMGPAPQTAQGAPAPAATTAAAPAAAPTVDPAAAPTAPPANGGGGGGGISLAGGVSGPVGAAGAGASVSWSGWKSSDGTTPNDKCVKESNKELCWDGVDNNCNGQIDEGCPYGGGESALHFVIAWKANVDLDLHVAGPDGKEVSFKQRAAGSLVLDKDCHGDDCPSGNVENVFVPVDKVVAKGHYVVWVQDGNPKADKEPQIPFMIGLGVGAKAFFVPAMITNKAGEKRSYEFDVI